MSEGEVVGALEGLLGRAKLPAPIKPLVLTSLMKLTARLPGQVRERLEWEGGGAGDVCVCVCWYMLGRGVRGAGEAHCTPARAGEELGLSGRGRGASFMRCGCVCMSV